MVLKSAILLTGCLTAAAAATTTAEPKPSQSRFLRQKRKVHDVKRGAAINRKLTQANTKTSSVSPQHELDITAEDVGFWTRTLQSSYPPAPRPTRRPTTPRTPNPTDPGDTPAPTPNPTDAPVTPNPTDVETLNPTAVPTPAPSLDLEPTPSPTTMEPTLVPTDSPTFPCNLTPDERATQIRELLSTISDPDLFDDPSSPQAQALEWITNEDTIEPIMCPNQSGEGCTLNGAVNPIVQRYVLAVFYYGTEGESWTNCSEEGVCDRVVTPFGVSNDRVGDTSTENWLSPMNECEWGGIACYGADTPNLNLCIDQLDFEDDGLGGELVSELSVLNTLRFLILEQGTISGPIPTEFGDLNRLLILDMDFNQITGVIPDEIYGLNSLQQLDLNDNEITGSISSNIGDLQFLTFFQVDHNQLSDTIPSEMGDLSNLRIAFLSDNDLTGEMPSEVCALRNNTSPPGVLGVLVTDCSGNPPEVDCPCCSSCA
mmetsp:Transcript_37952/g.70151  ORF Transcript_37952/g.70151 Transcript_37952/m.70151 type:complete len:485 (+) Transcript_37952:123-1577(+)